MDQEELQRQKFAKRRKDIIVASIIFFIVIIPLFGLISYLKYERSQTEAFVFLAVIGIICFKYVRQYWKEVDDTKFLTPEKPAKIISSEASALATVTSADVLTEQLPLPSELTISINPEIYEKRRKGVKRIQLILYALLIIGLVLCIKFAGDYDTLRNTAHLPDDSLNFPENMAKPITYGCILLIFIFQFWRNSSAAKKSYELAKAAQGKEFILTPTELRCSIILIGPLKAIRTVAKFKESYITVSWDRIQRFAVRTNMSAGSGQQMNYYEVFPNPPLWDILKSFAIDRALLADNEKSILEYIRQHANFPIEIGNM
jgi:hypothetical protein